MIRIAHLSDPHFGTDLPEVTAAITRQLSVMEIDLLILSGDITQRARKAEFQKAADFLNALPIPKKMTIPGNHDIPLYNLFDRVFRPFRNYSQFFEKTETVHYFTGAAVVGLNSTQPFRHTQGALSPLKLRETLKTVRSNLKESDFLIITLHHPLAVMKQQDDKNRLIGYTEIAEIFSEYGADAVLTGHVHFPIVTSCETVLPVEKPFILCGTGTALSYRTRRQAPNMFHYLTLSPAKSELSIKQYEYNGADFRETETKLFRKKLQSGGWRESEEKPFND